MEKSAIHQLPRVEPMRRSVSDRAAGIAATIAITRTSLPLLGVRLRRRRGALGRSAGGDRSRERQQGRP